MMKIPQAGRSLMIVLAIGASVTPARASAQAAPADAQQPAPPRAQQPVQTPVVRITLEDAKKAVDAAEAEARKNNWKMVFIVADAEGTPIYLRRMDGVPKQNYDIAMNKVHTVITSGMHTVDYAAGVKAGTVKPIEGAFTYEGGLLMRRADGQIVGAFAASGARGNEDAQTVKAGLTAIGIKF